MARYDKQWVQSKVGSFHNLVHMRLPHVPESYDYQTKKTIRGHMIDLVRSVFGKSKPVRMLTLPHVCMIDWYQFSKKLKMEPNGSWFVEHNALYCEYIRSWLEAADILDYGEVLQGIQMYEGKLSEATGVIEGQFEVVNFDFDTPWNNEIKASLRNLFQRGLMTRPGVLFLTLNISARHMSRMSYGKLINLFTRRVWDTTIGTAYTCHYKWDIPWQSETGKSDLHVLAFEVHDKEKKQRKKA